MSLRLHRELWDWLYLNPDMDKKDWPGWYSVEELPECLCFACSAALKKNKVEYYSARKCKNCPLVWSSDCCANSYYETWHRLKNFLNRRLSLSEKERIRMKIAQIAKKIRDLPVKEEWKSHPDWNPSLLM